MDSINRLSEDNIGGSKNYLLIVPYDGIDVFPDVIRRNIVSAITLLPDVNWLKWEFTEETLHFKEIPVDEGGTKGYQTEIIGILPKHRLELIRTVMSSTYTRAIIIYVDANGSAIVIGKVDKPAQITRPEIDPKAVNNLRNDLQVTINCFNTQPSPFYQVDLPEADPAPTVIEDSTPGDEPEIITTAKIKLAADLESVWTTWDGVLLKGQVAISTDVFIGATTFMDFKIGNGVDIWSALPYISTTFSVAAATLADTLTAGKQTGEQTIESDNGRSILSIINSQSYIGYSHAGVESNISMLPAYFWIQWADGTDSGGFFVDAARTEITHSQAINLVAPVIGLPNETPSRIMATDVTGNIDTPYTFSTDGTLAADSDTIISSQKAIKAYADNLLSTNDALVFIGVIDCSANPNYPAADKGHTYKISVAGKIGGGAGINVEIGDTAYCITDGSASGDHATVGANWTIIQSNIDGAVIGPVASTDGNFSLFDGVTGKLIKNSTYSPSSFQLSDIELDAIAGLTSAADKFPYFTGSGTASLLTIVAAIRTLLASADVSAFRTNAGLAIGSDVQAYDSDLAAIAALAAANDDIIQRKAGAWTNRTIAQAVADFATITGFGYWTRALFKMSAQFTHTGNTTETIAYTSASAVLNSTNISVSDILKLMFICGGTSGANNKTIKIYANTAADLSGTPIQLSTVVFTTGNNSSSGYIRHINFISLTQQLMFPMTTSNWSDNGNATSGIATDPALNLSANSYYIIVTVQLANSGDTVRVNFGLGEIFR